MRKKAWGADHMMRSGKRSEDEWYPIVLVVQDGVDGPDYPAGVVVHDDYPGGVVDHDDDYPAVVDHDGPGNVYRVSRSGITRNSWGGVHMLRTGKRSGQRQDWGQDFLRSLRNRTGLNRRGMKGSYFGGSHMMRSGK